jgi:hypothetical protein
MAAAKLAQEKPGQTLNATALVHEAYLRLVGDQHFDGRGHFFAAAGEAMRRVLVDNARRKLSAKRGGSAQRLPLSDVGRTRWECNKSTIVRPLWASNSVSSFSPAWPGEGSIYPFRSILVHGAKRCYVSAGIF